MSRGCSGLISNLIINPAGGASNAISHRNDQPYVEKPESSPHHLAKGLAIEHPSQQAADYQRDQSSQPKGHVPTAEDDRDSDPYAPQRDGEQEKHKDDADGFHRPITRIVVAFPP